MVADFAVGEALDPQGNNIAFPVGQGVLIAYLLNWRRMRLAGIFPFCVLLLLKTLFPPQARLEVLAQDIGNFHFYFSEIIFVAASKKVDRSQPAFVDGKGHQEGIFDVFRLPHQAIIFRVFNVCRERAVTGAESHIGVQKDSQKRGIRICAGIFIDIIRQVFLR